MDNIDTKTNFDLKRSIRLRFLLTILLFTALFSFQYAAAQQVVEVDTYLAKLKGSDMASAVQLESLIYDVQPTVYLNDGVFMPKGNGQMVVANIGAMEIGKLKEGHASLRSVNLLMVEFLDNQELGTFRLEPSTLAALPDLSYVFFSLGFDASAQEVSSILQGFEDSGLIFIYESARPF